MSVTSQFEVFLQCHADKEDNVAGSYSNIMPLFSAPRKSIRNAPRHWSSSTGSISKIPCKELGFSFVSIHWQKRLNDWSIFLIAFGFRKSLINFRFLSDNVVISVSASPLLAPVEWDVLAMGSLECNVPGCGVAAHASPAAMLKKIACPANTMASDDVHGLSNLRSLSWPGDPVTVFTWVDSISTETWYRPSSLSGSIQSPRRLGTDHRHLITNDRSESLNDNKRNVYKY